MTASAAALHKRVGTRGRVELRLTIDDTLEKNIVRLRTRQDQELWPIAAEYLYRNHLEDHLAWRRVLPVETLLDQDRRHEEVAQLMSEVAWAFGMEVSAADARQFLVT